MLICDLIGCQAGQAKSKISLAICHFGICVVKHCVGSTKNKSGGQIESSLAIKYGFKKHSIFKLLRCENWQTAKLLVHQNSVTPGTNMVMVIFFMSLLSKPIESNMRLSFFLRENLKQFTGFCKSTICNSLLNKLSVVSTSDCSPC